MHPKCRSQFMALILCLALIGLAAPASAYTLLDTRQSSCFDNQSAISCPREGADFYGQDAQYTTTLPAYEISSDGLTVIDHATGLTWTRSPDINGDGEINASDKLNWDQALAYAATLNQENYGGHGDWRLPSIKELYSLMDFRGVDIGNGENPNGRPFIDTAYFTFSYGDTAAGDRAIDMQYLSSTAYVSTVMNGQAAAFGLNVADGRIKGYGRASGFARYALFVRGDTGYAVNAFADNGDGTVSDNATGSMWQQGDSGSGLVWQDALAYCQNLSLAGHGDWRLPDAKELQSIVDYTRSPDATGSAAIDPVFSASSITNEGGAQDWPYYWTGTTHESQMMAGQAGAYIAFGRALGWMNGTLMDVHGAGAQRSDPKTGDPADYPNGHGPQGDVVRIYNYVRCVRGGT